MPNPTAALARAPRPTAAIPAECLIRILATHAHQAFRDAYDNDAANEMRDALHAIATQPLSEGALATVEVDAETAMRLAFAYNPAAQLGFDAESTEGYAHPAVVAGDAVLILIHEQHPEIYARHI